MTKPLLAITQGDPTGVGPETIVGAWATPAMHDICRGVVVGNPTIFRRAVELLRTGVDVVTVGPADLASVDSSPNRIPCLQVGDDAILDAPIATIDARGGQAAYDALVAAARLAIDRHVDGIVTAPLHKAALWRAGHHYPGHTELLAELCGVTDFAMMLYLGLRENSGLGVVHVTLHMALADVFKHVSSDAVLAKARLIDRTMQAIDGVKPRIGVCALNPHAGEEGLFGDEEQRIIAPAIEMARKAGLQIEGPLPADTLMVRARDGEFNAVVAMYHDQGHIAIKLLGMHRAVNVTLGLPIVRTSVAHGTAFDLAWQGRAEYNSMLEAIRVAVRLCRK
jgi:4-phospho-D-threonate 3-dehydrogenase / 4-phospho-D-erythronate 3-dehydrogenase